MCGIFGVIYKDGVREPDKERLVTSARRIAHRGPDGQGIHSEAGIGFAHTRLSLVDLDPRSNQPFWDAQNQHCLVFNGEIYNFRQLRQELTERGVEFRTASDTEVLLQCLIAFGYRATLPRLRGMFAFAYFDRRRKSVVLARDRFGIKPLHVYQDDEKLIFASEIKAMTPWITPLPNSMQIIRYLMDFGAPVRDSGFYANIDIVPPGTVTVINPGTSPEQASFCQIPDMFDAEHAARLERLTPNQAVDRIDELLNQAVERMMFADTPVGALCSGGVDSSVLMAIATKYHNNLAIFHANVVGPLSEFDAASALAKHLKLDLLTVETRDDDFVRLTPEVMFHYEQPFYGHPHSVPFMMVSSLVHQHGVKAVLTGEASDECFLGYEYLALEPMWAAYDRLVDRLRRLVNKIPVIGDHLWETPGVSQRLVPDMLGQFQTTLDMRDTRATYAQRMGKTSGMTIRSVDMLSGHLRTLLHRNDTMGMRASLEARFPFLDEDLVATAINMPTRFKLRFSPTVWEKDHPFIRDKWVLRRVADRYLPQSLSHRKKRGFDVSAFRRMRIHPDFFDSGFVTGHFKLGRREADHLFATADRRLTGKLMMLEVWGRLFFQGATIESVQTDLGRCASY